MIQILVPVIGDIVKAIIDTSNPKKGGGMTESIILVILVVALVALALWGSADTDRVVDLIQVLIGAIFGKRYGEDRERKRKSIEDIRSETNERKPENRR